MDTEEAKQAALAQLAGITQAILLLEKNRLIQVRKAIESGARWSEVGDQLHITRSGAWRKYHELIESEDGTYSSPSLPEAPTG